MDQKQRPQPSVGPAPRADRQPREKRRERHQRIAQQVEAEKEIHLPEIQQDPRLLRQAAEAHRGKLREVDQQDDGRIHARKHGGDIARGPALRRGKLQEAAHHRHKQHRKSTRFR